MEAEFAEITTKLEQERQTREGFGRFMKHPIEVLTEKPENILIVCIPLGLLFFIGGFMLHDEVVRHVGTLQNDFD